MDEVNLFRKSVKQLVAAVDLAEVLDRDPRQMLDYAKIDSIRAAYLLMTMTGSSMARKLIQLRTLLSHVPDPDPMLISGMERATHGMTEVTAHFTALGAWLSQPYQHRQSIRATIPRSDVCLAAGEQIWEFVMSFHEARVQFDAACMTEPAPGSVLDC